jgi:hypothetical protein
VVLQISSSLDWRAVKVGDKLLQYVTQPHTSDIDHTGGLSEAVVTLPAAIAPHATVDLDIAYEGVVLLDATRLTRIGIPEDAANSTDWDQIAPNFTALRGAGYVAWYPITTEVANLSEGDSLFEVLARWKEREAQSTMHLEISDSRSGDPDILKNNPPQIFLNGSRCAPSTWEQMSSSRLDVVNCKVQSLRLETPTLVTADYQVLERTGVAVRYLKGHETAATEFADAAEKALPMITDWFGPQRESAKVADLPDPAAAPFESGALLLTPLANTDSKPSGLSAAHQLTHASFLSFRPWIEEGLAHFAQALYLEQQKGRQAALDYMQLHRSALVEIEDPTSASRSENESNNTLVNTVNEQLYRSKAMCVWWMLRDMVGDAALKKAIVAYKPEQDKEPSYMQQLIFAQTQRDLEWFFDDWVYRDRGLPDFKIESASARKTLTNSFMLAVTVENLGSAGAEVPIIVKSVGGTVTKRLELRGKSKNTKRNETPTLPQEVTVNDGSVPESSTKNNTMKVEAPQN